MLLTKTPERPADSRSVNVQCVLIHACTLTYEVRRGEKTKGDLVHLMILSGGTYRSPESLERHLWARTGRALMCSSLGPSAGPRFKRQTDTSRENGQAFQYSLSVFSTALAIFTPARNAYSNFHLDLLKSRQLK